MKKENTSARRVEVVIQLRHGDCFQLLKELETASVGAVITDPPYG